jgi:TPR repeat protein
MVVNWAPLATAPDADVAEASPAPPIWAVEPKTPHKTVKTTPPIRRDVSAAANVLAMRNNGYAALQERRYHDALALLQQATMRGDPYAPMYIGQIFEKGIGVPRDVGQASYWYGIAINRGNGAALAAFNRLRVNPY